MPESEAECKNNTVRQTINVFFAFRNSGIALNEVVQARKDVYLEGVNLFSKGIAFFWASTILVASTCFGADLHYCKGEVQSFSLLDTAEPCDMHTTQKQEKVSKCCMSKEIVQKTPSKGHPIVKNGKCCYNDQIAFKLDGDHQQTHFKKQAFHGLDTAPFVVKTNPFWTKSNVDFIPSFRDPPDRIIIPDFQVFFQVFRI